MRASLALVLLLLAVRVEAGEMSGIASTFSDRHVACPPYRINPYKVMGAAHRTLPCGAKVEVINLANGRTAVATIVDIGPCTSLWCRTKAPARIRKRVFDMLPQLASAIGSDGLSKVSLRVVK